MASQITHVVYGQLVLGKFLNGRKNLNLRNFFIGTLFPDIRYLGTIPKEKTHFEKDPNLSGLLTQTTSFKAGLYTHLLIDVERERVVERLNFYQLFPKEPITQYAMKFLEDEFTYSRYRNWKEIQIYLNNALPEEFEFTDQKTVRKWHSILNDYFAVPPSPESVVRFASHLLIPTDALPAMTKKVHEIRQHKKAIDIIANTQFQLFK